MTNKRPPPDQKRNILYAAARLTQQIGASKVSLERIAKEANISKGGLLYHFPNKRALLEGMVALMLDGMDERWSAIPADEPQAHHYALHEHTTASDDKAIAQSLLAAAAEAPELLNPARAKANQWLTDAASHSDLAIVMFLASEGLRLLDVLDMYSDAELRERAFKAVQRVGGAAL